MRYRQPDYYDEFSCIGAVCPATCCAGWQIMIDEESLDRYSQVKGDFGLRLLDSIDWYQGCFRQQEGRCSFLNKDNLCDLYQELGKGALCRTCTAYPRHTEEFEELRELSLSLSCPVAAALILGHTEQTIFLEREDEAVEQEDFQDFDALLFGALEEAREYLLRLVGDRSISLEKRMALVLKLAAVMDNALVEGTLFELDIRKEGERLKGQDFSAKERQVYETRKGILEDLGQLEVLQEEWPCILKDIEQTLYHKGKGFYENLRKDFREMYRREKQGQEWEIWGEQLLVFFLFTYFCGAAYDGYIYTKAALSVVSVLWIQEMALCRWAKPGRLTLEDMPELSYTYAREIEHSEDNLNLLEEMFRDNGRYGPEHLQI